MSLPTPIRPYDFHADLIWWVSPFKSIAHTFLTFYSQNCFLSYNSLLLTDALKKHLKPGWKWKVVPVYNYAS
jgi:hypothetical protein